MFVVPIDLLAIANCFAGINSSMLTCDAYWPGLETKTVTSATTILPETCACNFMVWYNQSKILTATVTCYYFTTEQEYMHEISVVVPTELVWREVNVCSSFMS